MTRKLLVVGAAVVLAGALVALVQINASTNTAEPAAAARRTVAQDRNADDEVARRATAPASLVALYGRWAGQPDKYEAREHIVDFLLGDPDPRRALKRLLQALAEDPTPLADDPMVAYAAKRLERLWQLDATYRFGRDLMLVQTDDKPRVVLAQSLVAHVAALPAAADPEQQAHAALTSDLADAYFQSGEAARARLVANVEQLGATDAAKALTGHPMAELDSVQDQIQELRSKIIDLRARGGDPALRGVESELHRVDGVDSSQIEEHLTRPF